MLNLIAVMW